VPQEDKVEVGWEEFVEMEEFQSLLLHIGITVNFFVSITF